MNLLAVIVVAAKTVPPIYQATVTIPTLALTASMACRVFRHVWFSARVEERGPIAGSSIHFNDPKKTKQTSNSMKLSQMGFPESIVSSRGMSTSLGETTRIGAGDTESVTKAEEDSLPDIQFKRAKV